MQEHEAHGSSQTEITTGDIGQLEALADLIRSDTFAMTFQSVKQYREALLNAAPAEQGEPGVGLLVEALEDIGATWHGVQTELEKYMRNVARHALAAYHKGDKP